MSSSNTSVTAIFIRQFLYNMSWPEWLQLYIDSFAQWLDGVLKYWHLDYLEYIIWLFLPIFIAFILPVFLLFLIYASVIFLHCYGLRNRIREAYASSYWDGARTSIASFWDGVGLFWHGYEITGLENLPEEGPALIVTYHGTLPLDLYYVISKGILYKNRTIHCVADKFVFKIPGWGKMCKVFGMTPGTVDDCISTLKDGHLLIIAPGGVREALFSNPINYETIWGNRLGFAKVVLGANVVSRDAFRTPRWGRRLFRTLYEKTRLPLCPIYGGFPVKMVTHLGKPLKFSLSNTPEEVKNQVQTAVNNLISEHQILPGSIFRSLLHRIRKKRTKERTTSTSPSIIKSTSTSSDAENGKSPNKQQKEKIKISVDKIFFSKLELNENNEELICELRPSNLEMANYPLLFDEYCKNEKNNENSNENKKSTSNE
ncbi:PlsC domain-containing protein [Meloidogyne graminicola]|uniref:PlsC domain-containing protein n=1 Tax=Meloidogyne graminicola TaxID=189291 RepID=A0A8S9ZZ13_9BILA|nr:PlsC domain-containing protein [Meloidogyne graminicola]